MTPRESLTLGTSWVWFRFLDYFRLNIKSLESVLPRRNYRHIVVVHGLMDWLNETLALIFNGSEREPLLTIVRLM